LKKNTTRLKNFENCHKLTPDEINIVTNPLVHAEKVYLPQLHIKLGLLKKIVKATNKDIYIYATEIPSLE
jgi:hypothetical protein